MKQKLNYKTALEMGYYIQKITKRRGLPIPIRVRSFVMCGVVVLLYALPPLNFVIRMILSVVPQATLLIYVVSPLGIVYLLNNIKPDGKKIVSFLWSAVIYFIGYKWQRKARYKDGYYKLKKE